MFANGVSQSKADIRNPLSAVEFFDNYRKMLVFLTDWKMTVSVQVCFLYL